MTESVDLTNFGSSVSFWSANRDSHY